MYTEKSQELEAGPEECQHLGSWRGRGALIKEKSIRQVRGKRFLCCHENKGGNPPEGGNVQMCLLLVYSLS